MKAVVEAYLEPNRTLSEIRTLAEKGDLDFLLKFGEECRSTWLGNPEGASNDERARLRRFAARQRPSGRRLPSIHFGDSERSRLTGGTKYAVYGTDCASICWR